MFHFVRLLKFLPAAYFINDFLSRVDMMTRIRLRHDMILIEIRDISNCDTR